MRFVRTAYNVDRAKIEKTLIFAPCIQTFGRLAQSSTMSTIYGTGRSEARGGGGSAGGLAVRV